MKFIKSGYLLCLSFFIALCGLFIAGNTFGVMQTESTNIVLINIDDLGWTDLGYAGSQYYETPNIDRLASEGMVFSRAYAAASNCAPSRAALFSGQYAPRTGVYTVENSDRGDARHRKIVPTKNILFLDENNITIADMLQQNGYKTAHVGKWHISQDPTSNGFDVNIAGFEAGNPRWGGMMGGYFSPYSNPFLKDGPEEEYLTDRLTDEAISFVEKVEDQPFFLNYSPYIVHTPIQPKPHLEEKYKQKRSTDRHDNAGYAAMVETMDKNVGKLIKYLKENGQFENTLIIFTSDNGGLHEISRQWPIRAGKGSYFEGGIRVPMIVVWNGKIEAGSVSNVPVSQIDLYPTLLKIAGIDKPDGKVLDGENLMPIFNGGDLEERPLFWHFPIYLQAYSEGNTDTHDTYFRTRPGSVIQLGSWKLHEYFEDGRLELYNLDIDIKEQKNLADDFPKKTNELHKMLIDWRKKIEAPIPKQLNPGYLEN